jgi:hypothetical protein
MVSWPSFGNSAVKYMVIIIKHASSIEVRLYEEVNIRIILSC